jgi:hypothetical protein
LLGVSACSDEKPRTEYYLFVYQDEDSSKVDFRFVIRNSLVLSDGMVTDFDPHRVFFGYDTTIVLFSRTRAFPMKVGATTVYVRHPNPDSSRVVDTVAVEVERTDGKLRIREQSPT